MKDHNLVAILIVLYCWANVQGGRYEFAMENEDIFSACSEIPGNNGIHDLFDMSEMQIDYHDGNVKCVGNLKCVWEGVQPTDRIQIRADMYKYTRGSWQPTVLTINTNDYCERIFNNGSYTYKLWSRFVDKEDHVCLNHYGHVYHHRLFEVDTAVEIPSKLEGRHKIVVKASAYDENGQMREKQICFELIGEYRKAQDQGSRKMLGVGDV